MSLRAMQAGLVLVVHSGAKEYLQTFASCNHAEHGNALLSGAPDEFDIATCDGREFALMGDGHRLYVEERTTKPSRVLIEVATRVKPERSGG